jgi:hypothetical protein
MWADSVDRRDHSVEVKKRVHATLKLDFLGSAHGKLTHCRQLDESRHRLISGPLLPSVDWADPQDRKKLTPQARSIHRHLPPQLFYHNASGFL